jgi:hypothetical protein
LIRLLKVSILIYGLYVAISLLIILPALNLLAPRLVHEQLKRTLKTEIILFNPFTMALVVREARLLEPGGDTFAALRRAEVNLSLAGLWRTGWVLDAVAVEELYVHVRRLPGGAFNFSDMVPADENPPAQDDTAEVPGITIEQLDFSARRIEVTDENRAIPYATHWDGLTFNVSEISTVRREGRPYQLTATAERGGQLTWRGELSVPDATSSGTLELANIHLQTAWRFLEPWLALELTEGRMTLAGDYTVSWADAFSYRIDNGVAALKTVAIIPKDPESLADTALALSAASVTGIMLDSQTAQLTVDTFGIEELLVSGFSEGSRVSLVDLFATSFASEPDADTDDSGSDWQASLAQFSVKDSAVNWRSEYTDPPTLHITPINIELSSLRWPLPGEANAQLALRINDRTTLQGGGTIDLAAGAATLDYDLTDLPLTWFSPNIPAVFNAGITSGTATARGQLTLADFMPVSTVMDGAIADFSIIISEEQDSLTGWEQLRWQTLSVDIPAQAVRIDQLHLQQYTGRLHIKEDGTINTQRLLQEEVAEAQAEQTHEEAAADPWTVEIPEIYIADSSIDFKDESLPLNFQTVIGEVNGEISGFATSPDSELAIDLKGSVDGYAPVVLNGNARPFGEPPAVDLGLSFEGVDLARLTPYSGTYAGYAIDRGLLNLNVHYGLANNRLDGDNQIVIDQLKLGERIESDKAVDLPIQLALALLTDSNGVIDLAVPVSGDVDDPEFSIGGVIAKAVLNLITKAITAPFTLLAGLVNSDEDLQSVIFPSGSFEPDDSARAKLVTLSAAMAQRPELTLVITGRLHPTADRKNLQLGQLKADMLADGLSEEAINSKDSSWTAAIGKRYQALGLTEEAPPSLSKQADAVTASIAITDDALKTLADERAASAKRFLVNEQGMAADRAVIEQADPAADANRFSGVEMSVDT